MPDLKRPILFLIFLTVFGVRAAYSCGCLDMTFAEEMAATDFVFVGKVTGINEDTTIKREAYNVKRYIVEIQVIENFKGAGAAEINLVQYETSGGTSCPEWNLEDGKTYLIYGFRDGKDVSFDVACRPTQEFDATSPTYKQLLEYKAKQRKRKINKRNYKSYERTKPFRT